MARGRINRSGINWGDPAAVAAYKREQKRRSAQHHAYNRQYMRDHPKAYVPRPHPHKKRGSPRPGERNGNAKLTARDVRAIRALYATRMVHGLSLWTQKQLAELFGVHWKTIQQITSRKTWKHDGE